MVRLEGTNGCLEAVVFGGGPVFLIPLSILVPGCLNSLAAATAKKASSMMRTGPRVFLACISRATSHATWSW
jgi:hypothetical protein